MTRWAAGLLLLLSLAAIAGAARWFLGDHAPATPAPAVSEVFAGIPPLAYVVQRVGGSHVRVHVLVQPGQDPHTFEPSPRQVMALAKATVFFKIGMPFESQLAAKIAAHHPDLLVVDVTRGIHKRPMEEDGDDDAPAAHEHGAEEGDPHVWLAPLLLKTIARNVADTLCRRDPAHADDYRTNLSAIMADLDALHGRITKELTPYRGQSFFVFHPAFGYFADAYGLRQEAVEMGGKAPTPRQLRALVQKARAQHVHVVFLQPQFDPRSVEALAKAIDGVVVPLDSLKENVIENLDHVAAEIARALAGSPSLYPAHSVCRPEKGGTRSVPDTLEKDAP